MWREPHLVGNFQNTISVGWRFWDPVKNMFPMLQCRSGIPSQANFSPSIGLCGAVIAIAGTGQIGPDSRK
jgi:hypothetical protein